MTNQKSRPPCPFYGFFMAPWRSMLDQEGNQCALLVESNSPCRMFSKKLSPNWNKCYLNNPENRADIKKYRDLIRVHPKDSTIPGMQQEISLRDWSKLVMGGKEEYV